MLASPIRSTQRTPRGRGFLSRLIVTHWRGQFDLLPATVLPVVALLTLWGAFIWVLDSVDWAWHYRPASLAAIALIVLLLVASAWGIVGVLRSAKRADTRFESYFKIHAATALVMACAIGTTGQIALRTKLFLTTYWAWANDTHDLTRRATTRISDAKDRLIVEGDFSMGTAKRVSEALEAAPWVKLVEFNSRGGVAIEGLALATVLQARGVDTAVTNYCASACITAFAAGDRRYIGPKATLALHSAGGGWRGGSKEVNDAHAELLARQGVAEWFIERERETPNSDIWKPSGPALFGSGLVTDSIKPVNLN